MCYVTAADIAASGRPASDWLELAARNLAAATEPGWLSAIQPDLPVLAGNAGDGYDAARALILDRLTRPTEAGHFVAVPARDWLFALPATPDALERLGVLAAAAVATHRSDPYPVSPKVYWVRPIEGVGDARVGDRVRRRRLRPARTPAPGDRGRAGESSRRVGGALQPGRGRAARGGAAPRRSVRRAGRPRRLAARQRPARQPARRRGPGSHAVGADARRRRGPRLEFRRRAVLAPGRGRAGRAGRLVPRSQWPDAAGRRQPRPGRAGVLAVRGGFEVPHRAQRPNRPDPGGERRRSRGPPQPRRSANRAPADAGRRATVGRRTRGTARPRRPGARLVPRAAACSTGRSPSHPSPTAWACGSPATR